MPKKHRLMSVAVIVKLSFSHARPLAYAHAYTNKITRPFLILNEQHTYTYKFGQIYKLSNNNRCMEETYSIMILSVSYQFKLSM